MVKSRIVPPALLRWSDVYSETELYKAAVRLYTRPVFNWRKALSKSTDQKTFYDFARRGLANLDSIQKTLERGTFRFRPGLARRFNFNGKHRILYIYPWEERLVDLLLYRVVNHHLDSWFSPHSYAYRQGPYGVDRCQDRIARGLSTEGPLYIVKRDIRDYFASIDHEILLSQLSRVVDPKDRLFRWLEARVRFSYRDGDHTLTAERGIPFGTAVACVFANVHLTAMDRALCAIKGLRYFRYADDILMLSSRREAAREASAIFDESLRSLRLQAKPSHSKELVYSAAPVQDADFDWSGRLRHLGLEFRAEGPTGLSRDKSRKIQNIFRFAFRRSRAKFKRLKDPLARARLAVSLAKSAATAGLRNVAIIDYYLKHVDDEAQLRLIDRWLAEEILSIVFGGHKKGHFRSISFNQLRELGLPSLVHRRRLIRRGAVQSSFFIWKEHQASRSPRGTAARPASRADSARGKVFSPCPEAAEASTR